MAIMKAWSKSWAGMRADETWEIQGQCLTAGEKPGPGTADGAFVEDEHVAVGHAFCRQKTAYAALVGG